MILVDTSVWIDHFRLGSAKLGQALDRGDVLTHPFVIGELACGNLRNREEILDLLSQLPRAQRATDEEVLLYIDSKKLMGKGIGLVDAHLLASVRLTADSHLWTLDKRLAALA